MNEDSFVVYVVERCFILVKIARASANKCVVVLSILERRHYPHVYVYRERSGRSGEAATRL